MNAITVIVAVAAAVVSIIQLNHVLRKERRQTREAQARFGYHLLDALFDDPLPSGLLDALDYEQRAPASDLARLFRDVFGDSSTVSIADRALVYRHVDAFLFHFDRFEHAIQAGLTQFKDLETPTRYYVTLLMPLRRNLEEYARTVGYSRAVAFLSNFDS